MCWAGSASCRDKSDRRTVAWGKLAAGRVEDGDGDPGAELLWWETRNLVGLGTLEGSRWQGRASGGRPVQERVSGWPAASMVAIEDADYRTCDV
jgi:hypothetical protein